MEIQIDKIERPLPEHSNLPSTVGTTSKSPDVGNQLRQNGMQCNNNGA